jgi:transcriptional regulator with PAS, ATPase and Fis domain
MINWKEIETIHVVNKLEKIISQWFGVDIFFVDENGFIHNFNEKLSKNNFKNSLAKSLLIEEKGRDLVFGAFSQENKKISHHVESSLSVLGPLGFEKIFISKIIYQGDFFGSVIAYSYFDKNVSPESIHEAQLKLENNGIRLSKAIEQPQILTENQKKYFYELTNLVSQEIVTFYSEIRKREDRIISLNHQLENRYSYDSMIGKSKPMQDLYALLDKIKNSESTVLIQGENGTGKELIAKSIHFNSPRKDAEFVTVNCSAFNENLLETELFGHVKGSFTGAIKDKKGLFEIADKGTLFLDEIGDMPLSMQVKLLRVLQEGTFLSVGGTQQKNVDVRIVAATNKNLKEMIEDGLFREDLYYRVNVINLAVPSLRNRKEDILLLIEHFIARGCKEKKLPIKLFSKTALERLFDYGFPGNIRELENEIERIIVLSGNEVKIGEDLLSQRIREFSDKNKFNGIRVAGKLKDSIEELEKTMIKEGLIRTNWNKSKLAKELGISRAGLIMKVEKYQLDKRKILASHTNEAA